MNADTRTQLMDGEPRRVRRRNRLARRKGLHGAQFHLVDPPKEARSKRQQRQSYCDLVRALGW
jgi:hypothetical protein